MGTAAGVAATVRRPVWCGQSRSGGLPAAGSAKRTPPSCVRCADSCARSIGAAIAFGEACDRRFRVDEIVDVFAIARIRVRLRWPPVQPHRAGRDRRSTASAAARLGARSANLGQTAHYSQAIAHFVDRRSRPIAWVRWGGPNREKTIAPPGVLRSSGRRRRRPAETAPRSRTVPHSGHGSGSC